MKILFVNGSPRRSGNSDIVVNDLKVVATNLGVIFHEVRLREFTISHCNGCDLCHKQSVECSNNDDFTKELVSLILESDALYLVTPVYQGGVTGLMKDFMDRCEMFRHGRLLSEKLCGGAAIGGYAGGGQELSLMQIQYFSHICAMRYIASWGKTRSHLGGYCVAYDRGEVTKDTDGRTSCENVLVEMVRTFGRLDQKSEKS